MKDYRSAMNRQENRMLDATMEVQWKVDSGEPIGQRLLDRIKDSTDKFLALAHEYETARQEEEES